jgi:hypothetical protein
MLAVGGFTGCSEPHWHGPPQCPPPPQPRHRGRGWLGRKQRPVPATGWSRGRNHRSRAEVGLQVDYGEGLRSAAVLKDKISFVRHEDAVRTAVRR